MKKLDLNGIYLVVDPSMDRSVLLEKVRQSLEGGVGILQIWNHWPENFGEPQKKELIASIKQLAESHEVPVLINDDWRLLKTTNVDGVHFDSVPEHFDKVRQQIGDDCIFGITCSNDLETVRWADRHGMDYISFCAMFPSPSVDSCDIVKPETVRQARKITDKPLFLSGGISPDKIGELEGLQFDGVAVISGILSEDNPKERAREYDRALSKGINWK